MKAKIVNANSGTTHYHWLCTKFSENEAGRDYPGEWISCTDLIGNIRNNVLFARTKSDLMIKNRGYYGGDLEELKLKSFILKNFDDMEKVEEIDPTDWERVVK